MSARFNRKYMLIERAGKLTHVWSITGRDGAVSIHATDHGGDYGMSGGVEVHSVTPTSDRPPSHTDCEFTGGKCWHDGSSLYFEERIKPTWRYPSCHEDHELMWNECASWYNDRFVQAGD